MNQKIILASTSPRRKKILKQIGLLFKTIPSNYEEDMSLKLSPGKLAKTLAYGKALDVAQRIQEGIVIGIDTFLVFRGKKLGKPKNQLPNRSKLRSIHPSGNNEFYRISSIRICILMQTQTYILGANNNKHSA